MKNFRYNSMILIMLIATLLPFGSFASASDGEGSEITVTIDGRPIYFDVAPKKIDGRVMVPLRAIFEGLGAEVGWEESTQTITGTKDGTVVTLRLNDTKAEIDGKVVRLDVAATKINGRTLVPARFVAESFGAEVKWDESREQVVINTGVAAPEGRYYFVYNSRKVTAEDLAAIKLYINKFRDTYNVLFDSSKYRTAPELYDALKAEQKKLGGNVAGVQIFGTSEDVPAFSYVHKIRYVDPEGRFPRVEENKNEKYVTDFFYSNFKSDSKYLTDVSVYRVFDEKASVSLTPEWPVSRLMLTKGEIAGYIERYTEYRKQTDGKSVPTVAFDAPMMFQDGYPQDDINFFLKRLDKDFGLFENVEYRTYYDDLTENMKKENRAGVMDLLVGTSYGTNEGAYQNKKGGGKETFLDRKNINTVLGSNYYTAFFWGFSSAKGLGTDSIIHDGLSKGKMINPIAQTVMGSNNGVANYVWAPVEQTEEGEWLYWYREATYEDLQNRPYYFFYHYFAGLDQGKTRLQSFHDAKVEYATELMKHQDPKQGHLWEPNFGIGFENIFSLHYLGLADYQ